jgi:uncharacterized C2H2 Zn-finger protein
MKIEIKLKKTEEIKEPTILEINNSIKCPYCEKNFSKTQALGGHVGKIHKKTSESYNAKMKIRGERTVKR